MSIKQDTEKLMQKTIDHLRDELKGIRTGRADTHILDNVLVEVYGTQMRIRDLANITTPESRQIAIQPYDTQNAGTIAKQIEKSNIGLTPNVDGNVIRLQFPEMSEDVRKNMAKLCREQQEKAKMSIRNERKQANDIIKKKKTDGDISEDELKRNEKEIQDLTDKYCKIADDVANQKEKEIMTV